MPAAGATPAFPANQAFPASIPVLVLASRLDYLGISNEQSLIPIFPQGSFVTFEDGGLEATNCSFTTTIAFLNSGTIGDVSCAADIPTDLSRVAGVNRFPVHVSQEIPATADVTDYPHGTVGDYRIAAAVWHTVQDAYVHSPRMVIMPSTGHAHGRGLRGGAYDAFFQNGPPYPWQIDFAWTKFTDDVEINGHALLENGTDLNATLAVWAHGRPIGTLTITTSFYTDNGNVGGSAISGTLNGRHIKAFGD